MNMPDFIENNLDTILQEWEGFAERQIPAAEGMTPEELRDLAEVILRAVAEDMRSEQSEEERHDKSRGEGSVDDLTELTDSARGHAAERFAFGFTPRQLVAEYRALRASVIRRWRAEAEDAGEDMLEEVMRFNEAIDESLLEAVSWYNVRVDDARNLLNGVLAHDLRSPLGAMLAVMDAMLHDDSLDARHIHSVVRARNSAARMKSMINDLLDFTRTRLGTGLPMAIAQCDMDRILQDVIDEQRTLHPEAAFRCEASGNLIGQWDSSRIQQLIANLLDNAARHGTEGSPITVAARAVDGYITVSVQNEGGEISPEAKRVIFDPLRRTVFRKPDDTRRVGMGLGLYIARQIAEAHDGDLSVDSSAQAGTTFTVRLPQRQKADAGTAATRSRSSRAP